ncbi:MAG: chromate resistance protein ChrB [Acidovorax sp.]|nr:chromate resistance protein ChrB [Acidovorax sp.]RKR66708.1 hypothetical protein C8C94_1171 [Acidovorax sp. 94]
MNQESRSAFSSWLLLTYKVPTEPSKLRVAIWRRIRSLGAVYLQSGLCVLPGRSEHQRQMRMVQSDIEQAGGEAMIFETQAMDAKQQELVVGRFKQDRDQDYEEFLDKCEDYKGEIAKEFLADHYTFAEVKENDEDLKKLKGWLDRIKALDFFGAPARATAEQQLAECEVLLENYANEVFEREQSGKGLPNKPAAAKRTATKAGAGENTQAAKSVPRKRAGKAS